MTSHSSANLFSVGLFKPRSSVLRYVRLDTSENASWLKPRTARTVLIAWPMLCFFAMRAIPKMQNDTPKSPIGLQSIVFVVLGLGARIYGFTMFQQCTKPLLRIDVVTPNRYDGVTMCRIVGFTSFRLCGLPCPGIAVL